MWEDTAHLFDSDMMEKRGKARHQTHQCGIDSRLDLTYMQNMGVNILIINAQKSSVSLVR